MTGKVKFAAWNTRMDSITWVPFTDIPDKEGKHMPSTTIQFFDYKHLPEHLQAVSKPVYDLAHQMEEFLPDGSEKSAGMRKLLEAKDCFVRAMLAQNDLLPKYKDVK